MNDYWMTKTYELEHEERLARARADRLAARARRQAHAQRRREAATATGERRHPEGWLRALLHG